MKDFILFALALLGITFAVLWLPGALRPQPDPMLQKYEDVLMENNELADQIIRLQAVKNFIDNAGVTIVYDGCRELVEESDLEYQGPSPN